MTQNTEGLIYVPEIDLYFTEERILPGKNWQDTKDILKTQGMAMPTPPQFRGFLKHLRDTPEYQEFYNDITKARDPWRAEWLNARFERREDGMYMISEDALIDGKYENQILKLDDCLMRDRYISLDEYLDSNTLHGLPPANIPYGSLYYSHPRRNDSVAGFGSNSNGSYFVCCDGDVGGSSGSLGVFAARKFSEDSTNLDSLQKDYIQ